MSRSPEFSQPIPDPGEAATASLSFEALIEAAGFTKVDDRFRPAYEVAGGPDHEYEAKYQGLLGGRWHNKGHKVRGHFELLEMPATEPYKGFLFSNAQAEAEKIPGRHLATAYELLAYAVLGVSNRKVLTDPSDERGWNGSDNIAAAASWCIDVAYREGYPEIPALWGYAGDIQGKRELITITSGRQWSVSAMRILCVNDPILQIGSETGTQG